MKKTILAMLLVGSSCAVFAQNDSLNRNMGNNGNTNTMGNNMTRNATSTTDQSWNNNNLNNSGTYNAYGTFTATPPDYVSGYVLRDYPMANDIRWQQNTDWWHGYYMYNDMPAHLYYNTAGQTFTVALPVHQTLIPDAVVTKANQVWGPTLYDITMIKGSQGQDVYHIRTIENGMVADQWVDENGNKVIDVFRVDADLNTGGNTGSNMNQTGTDMNQTGTDVNSNSGMNNNSQMDNSTMGGSGKMKIKTETSDGKEIKTKIKDGKVVKQKKS